MINFLFNYFSIRKYQQNGAAMGTVLAELTGVLIMLYFAHDRLKEVEFYSMKNLKYIWASLVMAVVVLGVKFLSLGNVVTLILAIFLGGTTYFICLLIMKEDIVVQGIEVIRKKIRK